MTKNVATVQAKLARPPTIEPMSCPAPWRRKAWSAVISPPTTSWSSAQPRIGPSRARAAAQPSEGRVSSPSSERAAQAASATLQKMENAITSTAPIDRDRDRQRRARRVEAGAGAAERRHGDQRPDPRDDREHEQRAVGLTIAQLSFDRAHPRPMRPIGRPYPARRRRRKAALTRRYGSG